MRTGIPVLTIIHCSDLPDPGLRSETASRPRGLSGCVVFLSYGLSGSVANSLASDHDFPGSEHLANMTINGVTHSKPFLDKYKNLGNPERRHRLIEAYLPIVTYEAQRLSTKLPANVTVEDLSIAGVFGLMEAIYDFDSTRNVKFDTYCTAQIHGTMLDELRELDWLPRLERWRVQRLEDAYHTLEARIRRAPTDAEIAGELDLSLHEYHSLLNEVCAARVSPQEPSSPEEETNPALESQQQKMDNNSLGSLAAEIVRFYLTAGPLAIRRCSDSGPQSQVRRIVKIVDSLVQWREFEDSLRAGNGTPLQNRWFRPLTGVKRLSAGLSTDEARTALTNYDIAFQVVLAILEYHTWPIRHSDVQMHLPNRAMPSVNSMRWKGVDFIDRPWVRLKREIENVWQLCNTRLTTPRVLDHRPPLLSAASDVIIGTYGELPLKKTWDWIPQVNTIFLLEGPTPGTVEREFCLLDCSLTERSLKAAGLAPPDSIGGPRTDSNEPATAWKEITDKLYRGAHRPHPCEGWLSGGPTSPSSERYAPDRKILGDQGPTVPARNERHLRDERYRSSQLTSSKARGP